MHMKLKGENSTWALWQDQVVHMDIKLSMVALPDFSPLAQRAFEPCLIIFQKENEKPHLPNVLPRSWKWLKRLSCLQRNCCRWAPGAMPCSFTVVRVEMSQQDCSAQSQSQTLSRHQRTYLAIPDSNFQLVVVVHASSPCTLDAEAGESWFRGQP